MDVTVTRLGNRPWSDELGKYHILREPARIESRCGIAVRFDNYAFVGIPLWAKPTERVFKATDKQMCRRCVKHVIRGD